MADLKLSDLLAAQSLVEDTFFYGIQNGVSKKIAANVLVQNLNDPVFKGRIIFEGVQLIKGTDRNQTISLAKSRTEFSVGPFVVYPTLPNSPVDGLVKIITLANVQGGSVQITTANSRIYPNVSVSFEKQGESIMLIYSANSYANGWVILGSTPGLKTSLPLPEANVTDERIRRAISAKDETINYDEANGTIQIGNLSNIITDVSLANVTTDDLREGNINFYFTNSRAIIALTPDLDALRKPNANIIYVAKNGDDALDGLTMANAIANIHVGLSRVNAFWSVHVFPGEYTLHNNPVTIPKKAALMGNDLRSVTVRPENPTSDMFYVNNGCYVNGFTFRGHVAANPADVRQASAVFSYNPDGSAGNITTSPYIQNCSSITTTGTGIRVNGNYVGGLKSMVLDAFTQFNEGGIGIYLLNQGYMQLVSLFTICCEYAVLCENGGFGSITNSNSSFGRYGLYADGVSPTLYSSKVIRQISSRSVEMEVEKAPNLNDRVLMANYNQEKCARDTGLIVDALAFDLAYQSNTQSRFAGLQYATQSISKVLDQKAEVKEALKYLKQLSCNVVTNSTAWDNSASRPWQGSETQTILGAEPGDGYTANLVADLYEQYFDIYENGIFAVTDKFASNNFPANTSVQIQRTANLLQENRLFIANEVNAFFTNSFSYASYIPGKTVLTDALQIVDSVTFDILHGGNKQTLSHAIRMYDYAQDQTTITNQVVQTSGAFKFIGTIIGDIMNNVSISNTYQSAYLQNTNLEGNVTTSEINFVRDRITDLTNIIENGPAYENVQYNIDAISLQPPTDSNIIVGVNRLIANKEFIRGELIGYVNSNWKDLSNGTRNFYTVNESTPIEIERTLTPTAADYNPATGLLTLTANDHGLTTGQNITIATSSMIFTCASDGNVQEYAHPRTTDPANNIKLRVTNTGTNTFTVNVGNAGSANADAHTFVSAQADCISVYGKTSIVTFDEKILAIDRPLANTQVTYHQGSYLQTSTHTFEYVGAGTQLVNALPYNGGVPIQDLEVVELRGGQIFYTSTDHKGDFRIGNELLISRATGTINGRTFNKSLFAVMTPYILALQ